MDILWAKKGRFFFHSVSASTIFFGSRLSSIIMNSSLNLTFEMLLKEDHICYTID